MYLFTAFAFVGCQSKPSNSSNSWDGSANESEEPVIELTEEELKEQLEATECASPTEYLTGEISSKPIYKGLLSTKVQGLKLGISLSSYATLATFKDISVSVKLISKTGSVIKQDQFVIYEYIKPNGTIKYNYEMSITNQQFKDYNKINWSIEGASCR